MVEFKITVANSNLARKINSLHTGTINRSAWGRGTLEKRVKNKKSSWEKIMGIRFGIDIIFHLLKLFWKTFLVLIPRK